MSYLKQNFCHNCGNQLNDNAAVCIKCGSMVGNLNQNGITQVKKVLSVVSAILTI